VENFPNGGKTRDKVAAYVGISGRTMEKRKATDAIKHRPRIRLTIRQRTRVLRQWPPP
jgi:hypothetical protein